MEDREIIRVRSRHVMFGLTVSCVPLPLGRRTKSWKPDYLEFMFSLSNEYYFYFE